MMQKYMPKGKDATHYQSLTGLSDRIHSGLDKVKGSKVGKFVYDPAIEGEALSDAKETVKNVATNFYYSLKEAPGAMRDKEKRSAFWKANKVKICGLAAFAAAEIGLSLVGKPILDRAAHTQGIGWSIKDFYDERNPFSHDIYGDFSKILNPSVKSSFSFNAEDFYNNIKWPLWMIHGDINFTGGYEPIQKIFSGYVNDIVNDNTNQFARMAEAASISLLPATGIGVATSKVAKKLDKKKE